MVLELANPEFIFQFTIRHAGASLGSVDEQTDKHTKIDVFHDLLRFMDFAPILFPE